MGLLASLAAAATGARRTAGRSQLDIANAAGVSHTTISRLERAASWPIDVDRIIAAYASECGVDELDLWHAAIKKARQRER